MRNEHPALHGYAPIYRQNMVNLCPGCGQAQWFIGRITAECAFCGTALPLQHTGLEGLSLGGAYWDRDVYRHGWHVESLYQPHRAETPEWAL
jgi:hypothetical protein